jgi:hypothetical protein
VCQDLDPERHRHQHQFCVFIVRGAFGGLLLAAIATRCRIWAFVFAWLVIGNALAGLGHLL